MMEEFDPKEFELLKDKVLFRRIYKKIVSRIIFLLLLSIVVSIIVFGYYFQPNNVGLCAFLYFLSLQEIYKSINYKFIYNLKTSQNKLIIYLVNLWGGRKTLEYYSDQVNTIKITNEGVKLDTFKGKQKYIIINRDIDKSPLEEFK
jgi:hypothetical protein